jgi:ABC-type bacteriocin/lantibiotic exporter with double-glycine peptidase domain
VAYIVIFALVVRSSEGGITTGVFLAFIAAFTSLLFGMMQLGSTIVSMLNVVPIYQRLQPILEEAPEVESGKVDPGPLRGRIEVTNLSFRYESDGPLILEDVSFHADPGEFIALVGPSGSGKSTLLRLLLGFEWPESGTIAYDGFDLSGLDPQRLRRQLGVVLQEAALLPGDIFSNIVGSAVDLTLSDAWAAARLAGLEDDVKEMPMGMHTVIAEGASTLSGGQRQRLMIARALVTRPRAVFFDEATSALDNPTQAVVTESLDRLRATRIVIAHRLSTIQNADRIYVLEKGRVVQVGSYQELVDQPGLFYELVKRQIA